MNDSDTEFFANDEDIENIVPDSDNADILTPEVCIHIFKDNEGTISKAGLKKSSFSGDLTLLLTLEKNAILLERFATNQKRAHHP